MARLALITALLFITVVSSIFLTGFSGKDRGMLPVENVAVLPGETGGKGASAVSAQGTTSPPATSPARILNAAAVAAHGIAGDCWLIIGGKVYNVTNYLSEHPGGAASITVYCGKEATTAFNSKGKTPAKPHSSFASSLLDSYYVGFLGQVLSGGTPTDASTGSTVIGGSTGAHPAPQPTTTTPPTDPNQPYRDAIYVSYPGANIMKLQVENNGSAEFKFTYNGKTHEGKMNAQYQITQTE